MSSRLHASCLFRKNVNRLAKWFFKDPKSYREALQEDIIIRNIIEKNIPEESYIELEILRTPQKNITVRLIVNKLELIVKNKDNGEDSEKQMIEDKFNKIKNHIYDKIGKKVIMNVQYAEIPECYARQYAIQLKKAVMDKMNMRIVIRKLFNDCKKTHIQGMKIILSGRLAGASMARTKIYKYGNIPKNDLSTYVDEYSTPANTNSGTCGIRVTLALKKYNSSMRNPMRPNNHRKKRYDQNSKPYNRYNRNATRDHKPYGSQDKYQDNQRDDLSDKTTTDTEGSNN